MKRIKLTIAYDGTNYCGWQVQDNGITVEEVVTKAVSKLLGQDISLIGASRTDSGVHARGNVAVFDCESPIPGDKFCFALNKLLPDDIVIMDSCETAPDFHPRHCDSRKTYEYRICNARFVQPTERLYAHHVHKTLDVQAMRQAAAYLVGEHDFTSFCSVDTQVESKVRTIYALDVLQDGANITIRITGSGFLYNMVRIIAGTLLQVGLSGMEPEQVKEILEARDRAKAGPTAPAKGLTLIGIEYEK